MKSIDPWKGAPETRPAPRRSIVFRLHAVYPKNEKKTDKIIGWRHHLCCWWLRFGNSASSPVRLTNLNEHKENISINLAKDTCTLKWHFSVVYCGETVRNFATECVIKICDFSLEHKVVVGCFQFTTIFMSLINIIKQNSLSLRGMSNLCVEVSKSKFTTKETLKSLNLRAKWRIRKDLLINTSIWCHHSSVRDYEDTLCVNMGVVTSNIKIHSWLNLPPPRPRSHLL